MYSLCCVVCAELILQSHHWLAKTLYKSEEVARLTICNRLYVVFGNSIHALYTQSVPATGLPLLFKIFMTDCGSASSLETSNNAPPWYPSHTHHACFHLTSWYGDCLRMKSEVNNDLLDNIRMEIILTDLTDSCMSICLSELEYTMWPSRFGGTKS